MDKSIKQIIFCVFWGSHVDQVLCPWTLWNPVCPTVGAIGSGEHSSLEDSSRACNARRWIVKLCACLRNHWGLFFPGLFVCLFIITTYQSHSPFFLSFHPPYLSSTKLPILREGKASHGKSSLSHHLIEAETSLPPRLRLSKIFLHREWA